MAVSGGTGCFVALGDNSGSFKVRGWCGDSLTLCHEKKRNE